MLWPIMEIVGYGAVKKVKKTLDQSVILEPIITAWLRHLVDVFFNWNGRISQYREKSETCEI